jgi:hypothetical protein
MTDRTLDEIRDDLIYRTALAMYEAWEEIRMTRDEAGDSEGVDLAAQHAKRLEVLMSEFQEARDEAGAVAP